MNTIINGVRVHSVGAWLPPDVFELRSLGELYGTVEVENIIRTTGVERVRVASAEMTSSDMCLKAADHLFEQNNFDKDEIDGIVFVSQTTDWILPATSISLQDRLGLSKDTVCIDIHYGCSGYIYGLFQAASWISCGACKNVLVLAGDTTSRMINEHDKSLRLVFGDCGTATIVCKRDGRMGFHIQSDGSGSDKLIVPAGGFRLSKSDETSVLEWDEDKNGRTKNDLYMDGMAILKFAITKVPSQIKGLVEEMSWEMDEVGLYGLHQANEFMVNYIGKKLKVDTSLVPVNVKNYGNTGPSTLPLLLSDLCSNEHSYKLDKVIMSGFGVGLSWGSVAMDLSETHFYSPVNK